jgi:ankyrin repeat protein
VSYLYLIAYPLFRDALQIAARNGCLDLMKFLVDRGSALGTRGKRGDTLFHLAAYNGHVHVMKWLSSVGVMHHHVDAVGQSAAHVAARRGELGVLKYLHEALHVDFSEEDFEGQTALQCVPKKSMQGNESDLEMTRQYLLSFVEIEEQE